MNYNLKNSKITFHNIHNKNKFLLYHNCYIIAIASKQIWKLFNTGNPTASLDVEKSRQLPIRGNLMFINCKDKKWP